MLSAFNTVGADHSRPIKVQTKGEIVESAGLSSPISIIEPQPLKMNELAIVESGEKQYNWRKTWTSSNVLPGDYIAYKGATYKVFQVDDRSSENFYRVLMHEIKRFRA